MTKQASLKRLLRPGHIAVIGGYIAEQVIRQCDLIGYGGEIWPVNPKRQEMRGRSCFRSLADLPTAPDAAFIATPSEATIDLVAQLAQMGAGGAVCYASGFSEIGGEGVERQERLQAVMGNMAVVGPNCYGVLNYLDGVTLWPDEHGGKRINKGVAIISQSGNISISFSMQQRSLPLAYLISTGNQAGITMPDYVSAMLNDGRVTAIGLHLEGLDDIEAFSKVALEALAKRIPIVVLKTGATDLGSQLTMSHTSSLAGADTLYDALFERFGILRVRSIPEFLESLKFLSIVGPLPSNKIASISCSGGEAAIMADRSSAHGLTMPPLVPEQEAGLFAILGERVALSNPLDYHTYIWGDEEPQYNCFSSMLLGTQDVTIKVIDVPRLDICDPTHWLTTIRAFRRAIVDSQARGVVLATMQENLPEEIARPLIEYGIAPMWGVEECMVAIRGAAMVYARQQEAERIQPLSPAPLKEGSIKTLNEAESKVLLTQHGLNVPKSATTDAKNVVETANSISYPVVIKLLSSDIVHKSDVGGVHLNLKNSGDVAQAIARMAELGDQFLVEQMAPKPLVELILGLTRDPQFGLALVIGAGGILVELFKDSQTLLFPIQRHDVENALNKLKIAPLLNGYRGQPPADKEALIDSVLNFGRFAEEYADSLFEVDVNPLFVYPKGKPLIVDAVVRQYQVTQ